MTIRTAVFHAATSTAAALAACVCLASAGRADAAQIALDKSAIVGVNSVYGVGNMQGGTMFAREAAGSPDRWNSRVSGQFGAGNIFDTPQGAVVETGQAGMWQSGDGVYNPGVAQAYITIDLGGLYRLDGFDLFNTHNGHYNDRGTGAFEILGANSLAADGNNGFTLGAGAVTIASGTLAAASSAMATLPAQSFAAAATPVRYLQFRSLSVASSGAPVAWGNGTSIAYGLNEMRVFGATAAAVPEPASWAMMLAGFGMAGGALRSTRRGRVRFA